MTHVELHHVLDPVTGTSADTDLDAVTAVAPSLWWAEVVAKVALAGGSTGARRTLEAFDVTGVLVAGGAQPSYEAVTHAVGGSMNSQVWWFVARSSGIVAWALLSLSVVWGLLLSTKVSTTRIAARRLRPAWLLGLHRHLGGLAVIFTAIHLIGIVADSYVTFSWAAVLVPMASEWRPGAVAFGVVAMYLLIAIEATSLAIRHLPRSVWRWVHRSSFVLYATATWHGVTAGTDAGNQWFRAAAWLSLVVVVGADHPPARRPPGQGAGTAVPSAPEQEQEPTTASAPIERPEPPAAPSPARRFAPVARPAPDRPPVVSAAARRSVAPLPGSAPSIMVPVASSADPASARTPFGLRRQRRQLWLRRRHHHRHRRRAHDRSHAVPSAPVARPVDTAAARCTGPAEHELVGVSSGRSDEGGHEPPPTDS